MNRRAAWIVTLIVLVVAHIAAFLIGMHRGARAGVANVVAQMQASDAKVTYGQYLVARGLAADLKAANIRSAKCKADLIASSYFDDVQECVSNERCRPSLGTKVGEEAPELLSDRVLPQFDYLPLKQGLRTCGSYP